MFERMAAGPNTLWGTLDECITGLPQEHRHSQSAGRLGETGPHAAVKQVETQGNSCVRVAVAACTDTNTFPNEPAEVTGAFCLCLAVHLLYMSIYVYRKGMEQIVVRAVLPKRF